MHLSQLVPQQRPFVSSILVNVEPFHCCQFLQGSQSDCLYFRCLSSQRTRFQLGQRNDCHITFLRQEFPIQTSSGFIGDEHTRIEYARLHWIGPSSSVSSSPISTKSLFKSGSAFGKFNISAGVRYGRRRLSIGTILTTGCPREASTTDCPSRTFCITRAVLFRKSRIATISMRRV